MTPHQDKGKGTLIIDRRFRRVGRIKRASGTADRRTFKLLNGMLDTLFAAGRLDVLIAIRDGGVSTLQVWQHFRAGELERLPTPELLRPLADFTSWAKRAATGDDNRNSRQQAARDLAALANADATIADLPTLIRKLREQLEHKHHPTFNRHRAAVQAFLREILGRAHRLYLEVAEVPTLTEKPRAGRPMSVAQLRTAVAKLEPDYAAIAWAMATTGMGKKELWSGTWDVRMDRIHIAGTKREGRHRDVPRVMTIAMPTHDYRQFRIKWAAAAEDRKVGDLRKTYSRAMQEAKIPRTRRRLYMGHGTQDIDDVYEAYEVTEFLREDARRLQKQFGLTSARKEKLA